MVTTIDRICRQCGKHFLAPAWKMRCGKGKFCSRACYLKFIKAGGIECICRQCGKHFSKNFSAVTSHNFCSMKCYREYRRGKRLSLSKAAKKRRSEIQKLIRATPTTKAKISRAAKKLWQDPDYRAKIAKAQHYLAKKRWQDPKWIAKVFNRKPTKPEQQLQSILDKHFPQFKYNGDFSLGITLAGHIPDFVNTNGKKELIEVFGDYWHSPEVIADDWKRSELGKVMLYGSVGYRCLVIWEHDLKTKSEDEIIDIVKNFERRPICRHKSSPKSKLVQSSSMGR